MARQIATTTEVDRDELVAFLTERHHVVLATTRTDGSPQLSPVTAGLDGQGRLVISTYPHRAKVHNIRRDPRVSACVLSDDFNGPWVQLYGAGEVLDMPDALEPLVEYYRGIAGEHPDWDEYRQAMHDQGKCIIRVRIESWSPVATGGFPAHLSD